MNPQDFPWTEDQQITVINPTAEAYKFKVHNKEYELGAGKSAKMPGYIAWVYVYGLASQIAQTDGVFNRWNEEGFRKEYFEKVYTGADPIVQPVVVEEQPLITSVEDDDVDEEGDLDPEPVTTGVQPMSAKAGSSGRSTKAS